MFLRRSCLQLTLIGSIFLVASTTDATEVLEQHFQPKIRNGICDIDFPTVATSEGVGEDKCTGRFDELTGACVEPICGLGNTCTVIDRKYVYGVPTLPGPGGRLTKHGD